MFFVLSVVENTSGIKGRISDLVHPPTVSAEKVNLKSGFAFYRITAVKYRGDIPWKEIEKVSGKLCTRAILPDGAIVPQKSKIKSYEPVVLPFRVLFNSAVSVIKKLALSPPGVSITVFDENGYVIDLIEQLVLLCGSIRIITACLDNYERIARRLLSQYGISLIIKANGDDSVLSSTIIISDRSDCVPLTFKGILFTNQKRRMLGCEVLSGHSVALPQKFEVYAEDSVDRLTFASALYELCGVDELENLIYNDIGNL